MPQVGAKSSVQMVNGFTKEQADERFFQRRRNLLINGGFDVWQRGESFVGATPDSYTADRWKIIWSGGAGNVSQGSYFILDDNPFKYILVEPTTADDLIGIEQRIEGVAQLSGKQVTLSAKVYVNSPATFRVYRGSNITGYPVESVGADQSVPANAWTDMTFTFEFPDVSAETLTDDSFFSVSIRRVESTTDKFRLAEIQLEEGNVVTPFEKRHISEELVMCQRYYWEHTNMARMWVDQDASTSRRTMHIKFPVTMRTEPALGVTLSSGTPSDKHKTTSGVEIYTTNSSAIVDINSIVADAEL